MLLNGGKEYLSTQFPSAVQALKRKRKSVADFPSVCLSYLTLHSCDVGAQTVPNASRIPQPPLPSHIFFKQGCMKNIYYSMKLTRKFNKRRAKIPMKRAEGNWYYTTTSWCIDRFHYMCWSNKRHLLLLHKPPHSEHINNFYHNKDFLNQVVDRTAHQALIFHFHNSLNNNY